MELRPYQKECLDAVTQAITNGVRTQIIVLATGSGKTVVFSHLPEFIKSHTGKKTLVLAHREELLEQAKEKMEIVNPTLRVEIEQGDRWADLENADVVIASVPSIGRKEGGRIDRFNKKDFGLIIVDECHHTTASSYVNILTYFGLNKQEGYTEEQIFLLGVTATPDRADEVSLSKVFETATYKYDIVDAVNDGYLSKIRPYSIPTKVDLSGVKMSMGDFMIADLSSTVNTDWRNQLIVDKYKELATGKKAMAFAVNVAHAVDLCYRFTANGIKAIVVTGETPREERQRLVESYKTGDVQVMVSVNIAIEGFDAPNTEVILMGRPTTSKSLYMQAIGRGTRLAEGKESMLLLDFLDESGKEVVTASSIIELNQTLKNLKGQDLIALKQDIDELLGINPLFDLNSIDLDRIRDYIKNVDVMDLAKLPAELNGITSFSWLRYGDGYKISLGSEEGQVVPFKAGFKKHAEIHRNLIGHYTCQVFHTFIEEPSYKNNYKKHSRKQVHIWSEKTLADAIRYLDSYFKKNYPYIDKLAGIDAPWTKDVASAAQINLLKKLGITNLVWDKLTKGEASRIIGNIFNNTSKDQQKQAKERGTYTPTSYRTFNEKWKVGSGVKKKKKPKRKKK